MLIQLIDSSPEFRSALRRELRSLGDVVEHADVISAIDDIAEHQPDIIISSVNLIGPNVFSFIHELRSYSDSADIPIILLADDALDGVSHYGVKAVLNRNKFIPAELRSEVLKWT